MKLITTLAIALFAVTSSLSAQNTLKVDGQAFYKNSELKDVIIEIYKNGEKYSETTSTGNGEFEIYLVGEGNYVLKAMREGYHERFILISTYTDKDFKSKKYHFELSMYKDKEEVPAEVQEIPLIQYRADKKDFAYVETI